MRRWRVKIIRTFELDADNPFSAGERGLAAAQRQVSWPEELQVEVDLVPERQESDSDG